MNSKCNSFLCALTTVTTIVVAAGCRQRPECEASTVRLELPCSLSDTESFAVNARNVTSGVGGTFTTPASCPVTTVDLTVTNYKSGETLQVAITPIGRGGAAGKTLTAEITTAPGCTYVSATTFRTDDADASTDAAATTNDAGKDAGATATHDAGCSEAAPCTTEPNCDGGGCAKKPVGSKCQIAQDCDSTFCVDGVCCKNECSGTCVTCARSGSEGTCMNVVAGEPDPRGSCKQELVSTCGRSGLCDGAGGCAKYANGATCGKGLETCSGGKCECSASSGAKRCADGSCRSECPGVYSVPLPAGQIASTAVAISGDGRVVIGNSDIVAWRWVAGSATAEILKGPSGASYSVAGGINRDGSVIVGQGESLAVTWTDGNAKVVDMTAGSFAYGVTPDGTIVVGSTPSNTTLVDAVRWNAAGRTVLVDAAVARAVSADGLVVVGSLGGDERNPFRWSGTAVPLAMTSSADARAALATNRDGSVVVGYLDDQGFRWTMAGGLQGVAGTTELRAITPTGDVIAGSGAAAAILWTAQGGVKPVAQVLGDAGFDTAGFTLTGVVGISSDGKVLAVNGRSASGTRRALRIVLP